MIGTPGFVGARLSEAREARGLTGTALAEMLNVKPASISQYEHDKHSPSPAMLEEIAKILNRPMAFFLRPIARRNSLGINYRSRSAATKQARSRAEARFHWLKDAVAYLHDFLDFPAPDVPILSREEDPSRLTDSEVEAAAGEVRKYWQLGDAPIADLLLVLENHGVIVSRGLLEAETLDAFSQWDDGAPYVFLGSDKDSAVRSRFDAAHELAHLTLHASVPDSKRKNSKIHAIMERQAHRFAGAFLLPESSFVSELFAPTLSAFRTLKSRWKVAIAAMVMRCEHLDLMTESQVRRAFINIGRQGWRKREPLDDILPIEQPRLLRRSFQLLVDSGIKSKQQIVSDLAETESDLEALANLGSGYFSGEEKVLSMPRVKTNSDDPDRPRGLNPENVLSFRRG